IGNYQGVKDGDALLIANFRADRARQIALALGNPEFKEFKTRQIRFSSKVKMTKYSDELNQYFGTLFAPIEINNSLGEIFAAGNLKQLRIAETEKYAHVTFF